MTVKRSISIRGHRTSISIEDAFWNEFQTIAEGRRIAVAALVARIDAERSPEINLSSAIRLFVLTDVMGRKTAENA